MSAFGGQPLEAQLLGVATRHPDVTAVVDGDREVSYRELFQHAHRVADHVRANGAANGVVAVQANRGWEAVSGMVGTLLAGATYLALDPAQPEARLRDVLVDSDARLLLYGAGQKPLESSGARAVVGLTDIEPARGATGHPGATEDPAAPAYLVYTSGSTGKPKGVLMGRDAIWRLVSWHLAQSHDPGRRTAQFAAVGFDVAVQEVLVTLCEAGTLVVFDDEVRQDARRTLDQLAAEEVQRVFLPTALLRGLAREGIGRPVPLALRDVICAGEQLLLGDLERRFFTEVGARLHNHYGPAETHVVTALTLDGDPATWPDEPAIGDPLPDVALKTVAGERGGELWIGGPRLADGYLNRGSESAEKFVTEEGVRWYRTGDLATASPAGWIYQGRADAQLKVSGFRVEPAEVEVCLLSHPDVVDCAVDAVSVGDVRVLRAHVVTGPDTQTGSGTSVENALRAELVALCRTSLPAHMTITVLRVVEALPVTVNGKIDRAALAAVPAPSQLARSAGLGVEETVSSVVAGAVGLSRVDEHANFFDLGLTSLLVAGIRTELAEALGRDVPMTALYEHSSVSLLVAFLTEQNVSDRRRRLPAAEPRGTVPVSVPMTDAAERDLGRARRTARRQARRAGRRDNDD